MSPDGDDPARLLHTDRGTTSIGVAAVTKIAGLVAQRVPGVHSTGGGIRRSAAELGLGDERTQGVSVEVGEREAAVDLEAVLEYGVDVRATTQQLRHDVAERIEDLTGLAVVEVNVVVSDLHLPGDEYEAPAPRTDKRVQEMPEVVRRLERRRSDYLERGAVYRALWVAAGFTVVAVGIALIALPGPAFIIIPLGLAMLSFEFAWAQRLLTSGISEGAQLTNRVRQAGGREKLLGAAAVGLALLAAAVFLLFLL